MPDNCVVVGRDVAAYSIQGFGPDCNPAAVLPAFVLLGKWKRVRFTTTFNWEEVTPSSAKAPERRLTTIDWRATLEGQIRQDGSVFFGPIVNHSDIAKVIFTEVTGGGTITCIGGIVSSDYSGERGEFTDSIEIQCIGATVGGTTAFTYTPPIDSTTRGGSETGAGRSQIEAIAAAIAEEATKTGKKAA